MRSLASNLPDLALARIAGSSEFCIVYSLDCRQVGSWVSVDSSGFSFAPPEVFSFPGFRLAPPPHGFFYVSVFFRARILVLMCLVVCLCLCMCMAARWNLEAQNLKLKTRTEN